MPSLATVFPQKVISLYFQQFTIVVSKLFHSMVSNLFHTRFSRITLALVSSQPRMEESRNHE